jgi:mannose-6-phosphate isomerase-like protein (cupin superfamily)
MEVVNLEVVNLAERFARIAEHWSPRIAGEVNDCQVRLARLKGEFLWHQHEQEDELFLVVRGTLRMKVRERAGDERSERELTVRAGEFLIMPRGTEHLPIADEEVHVLLLEPKTTLNTGNVRNERTRERLERI